MYRRRVKLVLVMVAGLVEESGAAAVDIEVAASDQYLLLSGWRYHPLLDHDADPKKKLGRYPQMTALAAISLAMMYQRVP